MKPKDRHRSREAASADAARLLRERTLSLVELYQGNDGEWRWRTSAKNGEVVGASSEGFTTCFNAKANALLLAHRLQLWAEAITDDLEEKLK